MFSKRRGSEDGVRCYVKYSLSCITAGDGEGEETSILLASLYSACFFLLVFISLLAEATLFIIMLKGLFWQGEQRNGQFWLSMHFPLRQRSDHCSLSSKVALVVDRFAFFLALSAQNVAGSLSGSQLRLHMPLQSELEGKLGAACHSFAPRFPCGFALCNFISPEGRILRE